MTSRIERPTTIPQSQPEEPRLHLTGFAGDDHVSPSEVLDEAAVEYEDDDYWDVQSDEEMFDREDGDNENTMVASKEFAIIRRIHFENFSELGIRRYDAFLYDGLLTRYKPEYAASPLRNPKTARVFAHFIHVVSTLRIYLWSAVAVVHGRAYSHRRRHLADTLHAHLWSIGLQPARNNLQINN